VKWDERYGCGKRRRRAYNCRLGVAANILAPSFAADYRDAARARKGAKAGMACLDGLPRLGPHRCALRYLNNSGAFMQHIR